MNKTSWCIQTKVWIHLGHINLDKFRICSLVFTLALDWFGLALHCRISDLELKKDQSKKFISNPVFVGVPR